MSKVEQSHTVKVHYKGKLNNGEIFDSSEGKDPLEFKVGEGQMIPGFENAVVGMEEGEEKTVTIPSEEAYGEKKDELYKEVSKESLPEDLTPEVGQQLVSQLPDGQEIPLQVTEVKDESIIVDANHPLAGQELTFEIKIVSTAAA